MSFPPADLNLNVVAMALSGYTDEKASLWREMCSTLRLQLKKPYLCAMFAFLTSEPGAYDAVLVCNETHVSVKNTACNVMNESGFKICLCVTVRESRGRERQSGLRLYVPQ